MVGDGDFGVVICVLRRCVVISVMEYRLVCYSVLLVVCGCRSLGVLKVCIGFLVEDLGVVWWLIEMSDVF